MKNALPAYLHQSPAHSCWVDYKWSLDLWVFIMVLGEVRKWTESYETTVDWPFNGIQRGSESSNSQDQAVSEISPASPWLPSSIIQSKQTKIWRKLLEFSSNTLHSFECKHLEIEFFLAFQSSRVEMEQKESENRGLLQRFRLIIIIIGSRCLISAQFIPT